ncbi:MAG: alpha/beta hydrolase [Phycisphaera sp.]|nr:alpha/beta hydrolase [Phycisphaera sp.]
MHREYPPPPTAEAGAETLNPHEEHPDVRIPLDEEIERLVAVAAAAGQPPLSELTPEDAREWSRRTCVAPDPPRGVASVRTDSVPGGEDDLEVRIYHPAPGERRPLLVHFHGGGWVLGGLEEADETCRRIACEADVAVVSVDYRLAPENPYPAAIEDAAAATRHVLMEHDRFGAEPERIGVSGDSAGGHLAAVTALGLRKARTIPPLALQYLIYPVTDCDFGRASMISNAHGRLLETEGMRWFWNHFCPDAERRLEWTASPIRTPSLEGTAPAIVALAAHDPLFSEGLAYARRLEEAGVTTSVRIARDLIHGFFSLTAASERADQETGTLNRLAGALLRHG